MRQGQDKGGPLWTCYEEENFIIFFNVDDLSSSIVIEDRHINLGVVSVRLRKERTRDFSCLSEFMYSGNHMFLVCLYWFTSLDKEKGTTLNN